jgi:hypothetical protein
VIDFLAFESQFLAHASPVWRALPASVRGRFLVEESLIERARAQGIEAQGISGQAIRRSSPPPKARKGDGPLAFVTSIGDTKVARRLGYRRFVSMEHGAGQAYNGVRSTHARHPSYAGGLDRDDTELFLCPNDYSADLWRAAYPDARVEVVGSPRLDDLPRREPGPGPVVAISFHWPAHVAPEAGTALGWYVKALPELAEAYTLIGHAHPKGDWPRRMERHYRRAGIEFVPDFDEVCRRADVYLCDNSTTLFEFAATGRPVAVLNSPAFRRHVNHGLRFWDAAEVGVNVERPGDLIAGVAEALQDAPERQEAREAALRLVYGRRSGAAAYAATVILDWMAESQAVADAA